MVSPVRLPVCHVCSLVSPSIHGRVLFQHVQQRTNMCKSGGLCAMPAGSVVLWFQAEGLPELGKPPQGIRTAANAGMAVAQDLEAWCRDSAATGAATRYQQLPAMV